jgi:anti-sigma factor RsiW
MHIDPCKDESLLSALIDGELPAPHAAAVQRHLEGCPQCRRRLEALQHGDAMLRGLSSLEPSADFDRSFWRKVDDLQKPKTGRFWLHYWSSGWRPWVATGLAAGLAIAIFLHSTQKQQVSAEEISIAQNMELLQNYDMIDHLDMLEQLDAIETVKEHS